MRGAGPSSGSAATSSTFLLPSLFEFVPAPDQGFHALLLPAFLLVICLALAACLRARALSNRLQRQAAMIAGLAHDLRTPLTQLRLFSESLLLNRLRTAEERMLAARVMARETCRVALLAENLLQYGHSMRGAPRVVPERFRLRAAVEEAVEGLTPLVEAVGSSIELLPGDAEVIADRTSVWRIVTNLVANALQHGPERQRICVGISVAQGRARLRVDDEGRGIPVADRNSIWQPFWSLGRPGLTNGAGLGLAIVRELCRVNGAECRVEDAPGGGARFVVEFGASEEPAPVPALLCEREVS